MYSRLASSLSTTEARSSRKGNFWARSSHLVTEELTGRMRVPVSPDTGTWESEYSNKLQNFWAYQYCFFKTEEKFNSRSPEAHGTTSPSYSVCFEQVPLFCFPNSGTIPSHKEKIANSLLNRNSHFFLSNVLTLFRTTLCPAKTYILQHVQRMAMWLALPLWASSNCGIALPHPPPPFFLIYNTVK